MTTQNTDKRSTKIRAAQARTAPTLLPMGAVPGTLPTHDEDYAYEIKWDGIRALATIEAGEIVLITRNGNDVTDQYPELSLLAQEFPSGKVVLDGEIVALDDIGNPSFSLLQNRMNVIEPLSILRGQRDVPVTFLIFDVLHIDGVDTTSLAYSERRGILDSLELTGASWNTPPSFTVEGSALLQACRHRRLEGIIAKRLDSRYEPGVRSSAWIKVKIRPRQEFVIAGWTPGNGTRKTSVGALLVGYYEYASLNSTSPPGANPQFRYAGKVGAGFSDSMLEQLSATLTALQRPDPAFTNSIPRLADAVFVEPVLVAEIEFAEWTRTGVLRQPSFKGLCTDKDPLTVLREYPDITSEAEIPSETDQSAA